MLTLVSVNVGMPESVERSGRIVHTGIGKTAVSGPRMVRSWPALHLNEPKLPSPLVSHGRPGFCFRVLREGHVTAGDDIVRTRRGPHEMTVAAVAALLHTANRTTEALGSAVDIPAPSPGRRRSFRDLLSSAEQPAGPGRTGFRPLTVTKLVHERPTITSVQLDAPGEALPAGIRRVSGRTLLFGALAAINPGVRGAVAVAREACSVPTPLGLPQRRRPHLWHPAARRYDDV
ncbi:hypothetical protein AB0K15_38415 [Amycolatopsis sp. NPDC049253]|uniref:hypothetical protein n=1 Tax=Amycolatopsis sp. NPDC049253 TaxID=3155274 RepID=UPI00341E5543